MVTSAMAKKAADYAAFGLQFEESAKVYGSWQPKKLYMHMLEENKLIMKWDKPLSSFNGRTALEMAKIGYSYHKSQHIYNFRVSDDSKYACTKFGLAYSNVGLDEEKNDFLEKIPESDLSNYTVLKAEPTPTPIPTPSQTAEVKQEVKETPTGIVLKPEEVEQPAQQSVKWAVIAVIIFVAFSFIANSINKIIKSSK